MKSIDRVARSLRWVRLLCRYWAYGREEAVLLTMGENEEAFWTVRSIAAKGGLTRNEVLRVIPGLARNGLVEMTWLYEEHEPAYRIAAEGHRWLNIAA